MIKANHKRFWVKFARYYSRFLINHFFRNIRYVGDYERTNKPVLIIANHFSWWDGFIQIQLNNKYFKRRFHFMMLERELHKTMILTTIGAFSVSKGKRSIIESLEYSSEILKNPENMLLFFPQGRIQSVYVDDFKFERGLLTYLLENQEKEFQFVFNINLIDYSNKRKPEIICNYKTYSINKTISIDQIEDDFNVYAKECKAKLMKK